MALSFHKALGPTGMGAICGRRDLLEHAGAFLLGGETVTDADLLACELAPVPEKYEAGIQNYAGAMGRPQFMPSSYRDYAVDSTDDGKRDIWNNWKDVAGSIGNYFNAHGWRTGEEVTAQATSGSRWSGPFPKNILKAEDSVGALSEMGVMFLATKGSEAAAQLLTLEGANGEEHWVGFHNFFVITRYNRNVMYALAVHQLGQEIALEVNGSAP